MIEATVHNQARIGTEQISLAATVNYYIRRAGIFGLKLIVPADFKVQSVGGPGIQQWTTREADGASFLDVAFDNRTIGTYSLQVRLARRFAEMPGTIAIPGVHPAGVDKLSAFVAVYAEPGVAVKTGALEGVVEIDEVYVVAGHKGNPLATQKKAARDAAAASRERRAAALWKRRNRPSSD